MKKALLRLSATCGAAGLLCLVVGCVLPLSPRTGLLIAASLPVAALGAAPLAIASRMD